MTFDGGTETEWISAQFTSWLRATQNYGPEVKVAALDFPEAGYSSKTIIVTLEKSDSVPRVILRLPPDRAVHLGESLRRQVIVQEALATGGIPVPTPATYEAEESWLGSPFITMPFMSGHVAGELPAFDPWITDSTVLQQRTLYENFTEALALVHRFDWWSADITDFVRGAGESLEDDILYWKNYLDWATDGESPQKLADILSWCAATRPVVEPERVLLWGDARIGNAIFHEGRQISALIDWETSWIGPAEFDIGYWLGLEALTGELLGKTVEGFPLRAEALVLYESALGRGLVDIEWFETFGVATAACISVRLAVLAREDGGRTTDLNENPVIEWLNHRIARNPMAS